LVVFISAFMACDPSETEMRSRCGPRLRAAICGRGPESQAKAGVSKRVK
jgi:hypothetical protein